MPDESVIGKDLEKKYEIHLNVNFSNKARKLQNLWYVPNCLVVKANWTVKCAHSMATTDKVKKMNLQN